MGLFVVRSRCGRRHAQPDVRRHDRDLEERARAFAPREDDEHEDHADRGVDSLAHDRLHRNPRANAKPRKIEGSVNDGSHHTHS